MTSKQESNKANRLFSSSYYLLLGVVVLLLFFGTVMILSASSIAAFNQEGDSFFYLKRHLFAATLGVIMMFFFARFDYRKLKKLSLPLLLLTGILLIIVLIPEVGKVAGGSSRWLPLGFFNLQPSEFAKLAVVVWVADLLVRRRKRIDELKELTIPLVPVVGAVALLVIFQPDLGTAIAISLTAFVMIFLSGAKIRHVFGFGVIGTLLATFFVFSAGYRAQRFLAYLNPYADPRGGGFHIIQSLIAFGSGGITGVGIGASRQKFFYLPAAHTDFILAIIGEELGLIGTISVILLFFVLAYLGIRISHMAKDKFGKMLSIGITSMILIQALINMGAVTGLIPITGIPLPLISYGSSSLLFTMCQIGILLNIAKQGKRVRGVKSASDNLWRGNRRSYLSRTSSGRSVRQSAAKN